MNIGDDNSDGDPTKEALDNLFKAFGKFIMISRVFF